MSELAVRDPFLESAANWVCDSYSLSTTYLATRDLSGVRILDAALVAFPLPHQKIVPFAIEAGTLLAGQEILSPLTRADILQRLTQAANGQLDVNGLRLRLEANASLDYYSETPHLDTWFSDLHLRVSGSRLPSSPPSEVAGNDHALRCANPPFDGIVDLCAWLQLSDARESGQAPAISLRVSPPVDMIFESSTLQSNQFRLAFYAHPKFDTSRVGLATREFPGEGIETRRQVSQLIAWKNSEDGRRPGVLDLDLANADSVLAMLTVNGRTVRRQWFVDPDKAVNSRYVATQLFDKELKQLRQSVLDPTDSVRFERGIAALLFLLGFSPAIQVETQAPDIVVATPGGKLAIIECTMKIADFHNKLGKLVDRRNALMKTLGATGHNLRVDAFLVCGLPREQIAVEDGQLIQHQVSLLCREQLGQAFDRLRTPVSPDEILDRSAKHLSERRQTINP